MDAHPNLRRLKKYASNFRKVFYLCEHQMI